MRPGGQVQHEQGQLQPRHRQGAADRLLWQLLPAPQGASLPEHWDLDGQHAAPVAGSWQAAWEAGQGCEWRCRLQEACAVADGGMRRCRSLTPCLRQVCWALACLLPDQLGKLTCRLCRCCLLVLPLLELTCPCPLPSAWANPSSESTAAQASLLRAHRRTGHRQLHAGGPAGPAGRMAVGAAARSSWDDCVRRSGG